MSRSTSSDWEGKDRVAEDDGDDAALRELDEVATEEEPRFFEDPKRLAQTLAIVVVLIVGIYLGAPKVLDLEDAFGKLGDADPLWVGVALVFCVLSFVSYVA